ncbi:hypothetical protein, partial [Cardiobacterium hominis]
SLRKKRIKIIDKSKFRFFTFAAPTPSLPHGGGRISAACLASVRYANTLNRFIANLFHHIKSSACRICHEWQKMNAVIPE